ncbi:MAG: molecular chaperone HtpG [Xanthomonadales bacterium]|nr:molecular chaperone HtpG [Gammaproteobacteria bacterium]NNK04321.1 molecular chaperone HtpG [Xanthomonadales bacterium]
MTETTKTKQSKTEKHEFQAEVREVLNLMIHSLYSNREIFLRELISNASDACDKLRFEALQNAELMGGDAELKIEIEVDEEAGLMTVRDNGIGMSRQDVVENIGTIARSGTRKFLESVSENKEFDSNLIGQFGVGFYSSFIVADKVTLLTRAAGSEASEGVLWESDGSGEYTLSQVDLPKQGTQVTLHLREDAKEFKSSWSIRSLVNKYSDHIGFPIYMKSQPVPADDDAEKTEKQTEWEKVNQSSALWTLQKSEISSDDYQAFYKHVSHDFEDALSWTHNHVEGSQNYTSLLYIPSKAPMDMMLQRDERHGLRLYVKRVFIMDAAEQLLPHYLRFMRGVVDSDDLPLNVSRELLQENKLVGKIRSAVVRRSLDLLNRLADKEVEKYNKFWDEFGNVLKEGLVEDVANREKIAKLLRFSSTGEAAKEQRVSLEDYVSRMQEDQDVIWYVTAENRKSAENSPHLEIFRKKGIEVLLMSDRIDEWAMGYFTEFDGKKLRSIAKGDVDLDAGSDKQDDDKKDEDKNPLLKRLSEALADEVAEVRASQRLTDSASCLVLSEQELAMHMRRMLEQAGQKMPDSKPVLEVNLDHQLLKQVATIDSEEQFKDWAELLFEQAVLAEGGQLEDPAGFVQRVNRLMLNAG